MKFIRTTFLLAVASMIACSNNTPFDVTYQITVDSPDSCSIFVTYIDSNGYKSFYLNEKTWTKQVSIPSQQGIASLLIIPQNRYDFMEMDLLPKIVLVSGSITHKEKHVEKRQEGMFMLEMIDPNYKLRYY